MIRISPEPTVKRVRNCVVKVISEEVCVRICVANACAARTACAASYARALVTIAESKPANCVTTTPVMKVITVIATMSSMSEKPACERILVEQEVIHEACCCVGKYLCKYENIDIGEEYCEETNNEKWPKWYFTLHCIPR